MTSVPTPPPDPPEHEPSSDDWVLKKASPLLGLSIIAGFSIGALVGLVKDVPPVLGGIVVLLIGGKGLAEKLKS